jgi:ribosome-associated protein
VTATPRAIELLQIAARAADDKQADDLVALDVSEPLPLTDIFLLASGRSERNVVAIAGEVEDKMLEAGVKTLRREGRAEGRWILLDFGDLVVHV